MATLNVKNFPDRIYRRIKQRAVKNRRSISQEVTQILENAPIAVTSGPALLARRSL